MKKALVLILSGALSSVLIGCAVQDKSPEPKIPEQKMVMMDSIKGNIIYRERIALPSNAVVTITLEDISLLDVAAKKLAEQTFSTDGDQVPLDFELSFDANEIKANHRYGVRATIRIDGKLRFTTNSVNQVITDEKATKVVNLHLVSVR